MLITDQTEYARLVGISNEFQQLHLAIPSIWENSPFKWITTLAPRTKGKVGEEIISHWLVSNGFTVEHSPDTEADRIVCNKRVEIKFSTLWEDGKFAFQQIRDQNYHFMIMVGLAPSYARCWVFLKAEIMRLWKDVNMIMGQHMGQEGSDTAWLHINQANYNFLRNMEES